MTETMRIEGQDATSRMFPTNRRLCAMTIQPSVDSIPGSRLPDQQLFPRIRTGGRRGGQHDHEIGD